VYFSMLCFLMPIDMNVTMKKIIFTIGILTLFCFPDSIAQTGNTRNLRKAIICLTYDDGLESQLVNAIPQLDSAGLKATFFINSIQGTTEIIGKASPAIIGWKKAALNGHELANHTLFHPCPEKLGWEKSVAIEGYTIDKILSEIKTANAYLSILDPQRTERAFGFPCNNSIVNDTNYSQIIKAKGLVKFGRTGGDGNSIITDFMKLDIMQVPSWLIEEGTTLNELIEFAEKAKSSGGMAVYQFHSIDGGPLFKISKETHKLFLEYLKKNQADFWIATFSEAMKSITSK
jgi:hypothetical protein